MTSRQIFGLATVGYLISWSVPVHQEMSTGFEAYVRTVGGFYRLLWEPFELSSILMAISPHTNYVVLGAAIIILMKSRNASNLKRLTVLLTFSLACNLVWLTEGSRLRFGYYLWLISFPLYTLAAYKAMREEENVVKTPAS